MKILTFSLTLLAGALPSVGEEIVLPKWDVEIPMSIIPGKPSPPALKPESIDFQVLSSRTTRMQVTESPEIADLPPIKGTINVTVQTVADPGLPDPPPPLPALPPDDPAVIAKLAELRGRYRHTRLVFLSASVYDGRRTLVRIYPNGRLDKSVSAWSNLDFNHFGGFSTYRVKDAVDGSLHDFGLLMGIGNMETARMRRFAEKAGVKYTAPVIPELPDAATAGPAFAVVAGDADSPAMDTLEQIHDLYRKEGSRMETAYYAREKAHAERKAYLLANPPIPEDIVIRFWQRDSSVTR